MKCLRRWLMVMGLSLFGGAQADSDLDPLLEQLRPVGSGELSYFGITLYRVTLLAPEGIYRPERPHALKVDYRLGLSRERMAWASVREIEQLVARPIDRQVLYRQLSGVLRDVKAGDEIIGFHRPGEGAAFYSRGRLLGRLVDPLSAADFFSIWLHPQTRKPDLRSRLLGER